MGMEELKVLISSSVVDMTCGFSIQIGDQRR